MLRLGAVQPRQKPNLEPASAGAAGSQDADTAPKKPVKAMLAELEWTKSELLNQTGRESLSLDLTWIPVLGRTADYAGSNFVI